MSIIVYEKRTCSTSRNLRKLLDEHGIQYETIEFQTTGLSEAQVAELVAKTGGKASELLRLREEGAKELREADDEAVIKAIAANPVLLQRSVVVKGEKAVLARPIELGLKLAQS